MTAPRRGDFQECSTCANHSGVIGKQEARDIEMREMHDRIDRTVTASSFYWITGTFILVLGSVAALYASGIDNKVDGNLFAIRVQNERLLRKIDDMDGKMNSIQIDVERTKLSLEQTAKDLDEWKKRKDSPQ